MTIRDMSNIRMAATTVLAAIIATWPVALDAQTAPSPAARVPQEADGSPSEAVELKLDAMGADFWRDMLQGTECDLVVGDGVASKTAVVLGPTEGGTAFRVVDNTGTLFEGKLPFDPFGVGLGRHSDGHVLAGFYYRRGKSKEIALEPSITQPVIVYRDGEKIYEANKAWDFDIASDGSSFYIIEPEPDKSSNLIILDSDGTAVRSHDLEYSFTPRFNEWPKFARFTHDGDEIVLSSGYSGDAYIFYPTDGGEPRTIRHEGERGLLGEVLASSRVGFYVFRPGRDGPRLVVRREFNWDSPTVQISEVWSKEVDLDYFEEDVYLSGDKRYLLLKTSNAHLLDAETGRILFAYPTRENFGRTLRDAPSVGKVTAAGIAYRKADRGRLASIIDVGEDQEIGAIANYGFRGGDVYIHRSAGLGGISRCYSKHGSDRDAARACEARWRKAGGNREVLDLFDLASIQINSPPYRRIIVEREYKCRPGFNSGITFEGGILRYLSWWD